MDTATKKPAPRSMSRTVVSAVVGLLIVIAIAGIVLAGRRTAQPPEAGSAPVTGGAAVAPTAAVASAAAPAPEPLPSAVRFTGTSDKLPPEASGELARLADAMRVSGQQVGLTARFVAGADKQAALELGRKRVEAVQHALQSNGVSASRIQAEMIEVPAGTQAPGAAGRVELTLR
jgi:outer membrane protein OmpA-like peptidoglycan-associated protein